jgi:hypothetical protein
MYKMKLIKTLLLRVNDKFLKEIIEKVFAQFPTKIQFMLSIPDFGQSH